MATYKRLTRKQYLDLGMFMKDVITTDDNGHAVYADGWSDKRVADELKLNVVSVSNFRVECFGRFKRGPKANETSSAYRIKALEAAVEDLKKLTVNQGLAIADLRKRVDLMAAFKLPAASASDGTVARLSGNGSTVR